MYYDAPRIASTDTTPSRTGIESPSVTYATAHTALLSRKLTQAPAYSIGRSSPVRSLLLWFLCSALMVAGPNLQASAVVFGQTQTVALQVPELDAGFRLLYELKFVEARTRFDAWQKSHPEDPLGSGELSV